MLKFPDMTCSVSVIEKLPLHERVRIVKHFKKGCTDSQNRKQSSQDGKIDMARRLARLKQELDLLDDVLQEHAFEKAKPKEKRKTCFSDEMEEAENLPYQEAKPVLAAFKTWQQEWKDEIDQYRQEAIETGKREIQEGKKHFKGILLHVVSLLHGVAFLNLRDDYDLSNLQVGVRYEDLVNKKRKHELKLC